MTSAKVVRLFRKSSAKYVAMSILGLACIGSTLGQAASGDDFKAQIETLRKSMEKYQDYKVAVRDLYLSTVACVYYSGEKIEHHMEYANSCFRHSCLGEVRSPLPLAVNDKSLAAKSKTSASVVS